MYCYLCTVGKYHTWTGVTTPGQVLPHLDRCDCHTLSIILLPIVTFYVAPSVGT